MLEHLCFLTKLMRDIEINAHNEINVITYVAGFPNEYKLEESSFEFCQKLIPLRRIGHAIGFEAKGCLSVKPEFPLIILFCSSINLSIKPKEGLDSCDCVSDELISVQ